jgi:hypothetical protein
LEEITEQNVFRLSGEEEFLPQERKVKELVI